MQRNNVNRRFGCGTIALGVILLCAAAFILPRFFGGDDFGAQTVPDDSGDVVDVDNDGDVEDVNTTGNVDLGALVVTNAVDRDGCPTDDVSVLENVDSFYVVAPNSAVDAGTDVFARLYQDNTAIEDVPIITADQDYTNTCINFIFEKTDGTAFEPGDYEVEFWVNGNAADSVTFRVE
jgi:hypothetical protein